MTTVVPDATAQALATARVRRRPAGALQRAPGGARRRGWLVRRLLLGADLLGLTTSFLLALAVVRGDPGGGLSLPVSFALFAGLTLPGWVVAARISGLYDRDEERAYPATTEDLAGVLGLVTLAVWLSCVGAWAGDLERPQLSRLVAFWALAIVLVPAARAGARALARRHPAYVQKTIVVGTGDVARTLAAKLLRRREYGVDLVGFVSPAGAHRGDPGGLADLGAAEDLPALVERLDVARVVVAFTREPDRRLLGTLQALRERGVQIDVVPRFFELAGPNVAVHTIEGLPLLSLPPVGLSRSSRALKRALDLAGASLLLLLTGPALGLLALAVRLDSPGPVFFRQTRLGLGMREFTLLKFRTLVADADPAAHEAYIEESFSAPPALAGDGLQKLERAAEVTRVGRFLRATSFDELPQLVNVLRGDMSLVGPRPCIAYEVRHFEPHHFDRFRVPAGLTGLWQVTARARSTFREALEIDVAYARGWSLGLDLRLLCCTPVAVLRRKETR